MTVYVDDMYLIPLGRFGRMKMSHMIADTEAELHAMADRLRLKREWCQGDHYDVSMVLRTRAIAFGAVAITLRQCAFMVQNRRNGYPMGTPETCEAIAQQRHSERALRQKLDQVMQ